MGEITPRTQHIVRVHEDVKTHERDTSGVAVNAMPDLKIALPERHEAYTVRPSKAGWAIVVAEKKLEEE